MRHPRLLSAIVAFAVAVGIAFILRGRVTETHGGDAHLPVNPFAAAEKDDWAILVATSREGTHREDAEVFIHRVVETGAGGVKTRLDARTREGKINEGAVRTFSSGEAPTIAAFFTPPGSRYEMTNATTERTTRDALGRKFECTKISFDRRDLDQPAAATVRVTAWLSSEVRGSGVLHAVAEGRDAHGCATSVTFELLGHGNGPRATHGKTPSEVPLDARPSLLPAH